MTRPSAILLSLLTVAHTATAHAQLRIHGDDAPHRWTHVSGPRYVALSTTF